MRRDAAEALGWIGDEKAVEPLISTLENAHEDEDVRAYAAWALGDIGNDKSVKHLIVALREKGKEVWYGGEGEWGDECRMIRSYAAYALGMIGDERAVKPLIIALGEVGQKVWYDDDEEYVWVDKCRLIRSYAAWALGMIGDERAVEPLIIALGDRDEEVRKNAAEALDTFESGIVGFAGDSGYVKLNELDLKLEKVNAIAMRNGFFKDATQHHVTIFMAHDGAWALKNNFCKNPKLITLKKSDNPRYVPSNIGRTLLRSPYTHEMNCVAILDTKFHISNSKDVWRTLCNNGIFDIWLPSAPFNRLDGKKDPMILLLRICEVNHDFSNQLYCKNTRVNGINGDRFVKIKMPIIQNAEFLIIKDKIKKSLGDSLIYEESVLDTTIKFAKKLLE